MSSRTYLFVPMVYWDKTFYLSIKCHLNFESNTITLDNLNSTITVPITLGINGNTDNYLLIPPRSESVHFVQTCMTEDCVIFPMQLCEGVFLGGVIATPRDGKIPIQILNTRDDEVKLSNFNRNIRKLNDYTACSFSEVKVNADRVKKLFSELKLNNLNEEELTEIENICAKFSDIFHLTGDKLTTTNVYNQTIRLKPNCVPVYSKQYRLPQSQKVEIERQIQDMLNNDIIEETKSEWSSPILLVPKKIDATGEQKFRLVIDYRKLNEKIENDRFPLPNITDILDSLSGAIYFSHLDLQNGYYQISLEPESRKCTAFTFKGQYQLKRMPMGLKTSPSAFSRAMTVGMSGLNYEKCFIYLDDLIVFGRNLQDHNRNLMDVFIRLRQINLKLNPRKCEFLKKELLYLGHLVTSEGIKPDPSKISALLEYPTPVTADDVRRFVAFANYYRKFIPNFAKVVIPLNQLLKKNVLFVWTNECEKGFQHLKEALASPPLLQYPDFSTDNKFILHTDASGIAVGSMLCNKDNKPIAYASRKLNKAELNYPTIEKELLAIVWSIKYFRPYLYGRKFTIFTDHKPLVYLFGMNNPSSRLTKFRLELENYEFEIEYVKGKDNVAADALSRVILTSDELKCMYDGVVHVVTRAQKAKLERDNQENSDNNVSIKEQTNHVPNLLDMIKKPSDSVELIFTTENNLNNMKGIRERNGLFAYNPANLTIYTCPSSRSYLTRAVFVRELEQFCMKINTNEIYIIKNNYNEKYINWLKKEIKENNMWSGPRICLLKGVERIYNKDDKKVILNDFHLLPKSGHAGARRMTNNIKQYYFWPNMDNEIKEYVKKCDKCQKQKHSVHTKEPMVVTTTATTAFDKVFLDIVGPLCRDYYNNSYILTIQCELTKYIEAYALENKDTLSVSKAFVENFILRYGIPREIASDRGTEFISATMKEVCKLLNITQLTSTAYHHESIGALENTHKTLNSYLRIQTDNEPRSWSSWIPFWAFSYNNTVHTSTKFTPYELVFGKRCNLPSNLSKTVEPLYNSENYSLELKYRLQKCQAEARKNLVASKVERKQKYDESIKPVKYNKDDLILIKNEGGNKLDTIWIGPYVVIQDNSPNVIINKDNKIETVHKNRTKPYFKD
ncbi:hypothetical protein JYU34_014336 [Plutella xylostella]|uniref:RNA-directed DNA polymerase n=1 Tax=Plutella xylostella TaxID=51655 RepID=A0ABQ7Q9H4_PLUXY|nr:hypothetical protein JYU34_014336 [Plutella xylostella]